MVEFALVLPLLLIVVFGIFVMGRMLMTSNVLATAAREGARAAAVGAIPDTVYARIETVLTAAKLNPATSKSVSAPDPTTRAITVIVTKNLSLIIPANFLTNYMGLPSTVTLKGSCVMRSEF